MMTAVYLLFDLPELLFELLRSFADLMATPVSGGLVRMILGFYELMIFLPATMLDALGIVSIDLTDFVAHTFDVLGNAPLGFWIMVLCLVVGIYFTIAFFIIDLLDRINFLT